MRDRISHQDQQLMIQQNENAMLAQQVQSLLS
jgi:hypothetical protein